MNEFKPKEGDRILVGGSKTTIDKERIYLFTDRYGWFVCISYGMEEKYQDGKGRYQVAIWPCAKPLPPKLPEFIEGDPVIVWGGHNGSTKFLRVVDEVLKTGHIKCFGNGATSEACGFCSWGHYKPLPNYDYGGRKVWGSEDNKGGRQ
jgi:hypothetical protein